MKYMIEYKIRLEGLNFEDYLESDTALIAVFNQWKPEEGFHILAFVHTLENESGYLHCETSDPRTVASFVTKFAPWLTCKVVPVLDVEELTQISTQSNQWIEEALENAFPSED